MRERIETIRRKRLVYWHEARSLRDQSPVFRIAMGTLMVLLVPLLLLESLLYLVAGRDLGFFPTRTFEEMSAAAELVDVPLDADALVALLEPRRRPALHLVASTEPVTFSKLGGTPDVTADFDWPRWKGVPLGFVALLDLAQLQANAVEASLQITGRVYFFYEARQSTWGFDPRDRGSWQVLFAPESAGTVPATPPQDLPRDGVYPEKRIGGVSVTSYPSAGRLNLSPSGLSRDDWTLVEEKCRSVYGELPHHQVGGMPDPVQDDQMELECQLASNGVYCGDSSAREDSRTDALRDGTQAWRLLLQVDTDDDIGMMWGDCGMLYFWVREDDLQQRNFQNVWMILQCC